MSAASLKVSGLSKNYGGVVALNSVDLDVQAGEVHGVIGPNGAGKSTLVDIISGFTPRSAGHIVVGGTPLNARPHRVARRGVVRTFQHTSVFGGETVQGNLEIAAACLSRATRRSGRSGVGEIDRALTAMNLTPHRDVPADALSYGAQRRLAIAIALVAGPSVLLLDEPAAGMNPVESQEFVELVRQVRRDRTVILIEHDMTVIRALCERSTVLVDGTVLLAGPTQQVLEDPRVVDVYLGAQT